MSEGRLGGETGALLLDDAAAAALLPKRPGRAHKGTFGRLLVVAGSLDYAGAALLVAAAAARTGAGLVTLALPASLQPVLAGRVFEATTLALPEREPGVIDPRRAVAALAARPHEALVVGSGLRAGPATDELVAGILVGEGEWRRDGAGSPVPAVFDAEALNALGRRPRWWDGAGRAAVLTPHPGEFRRLLFADREGAAELGLDLDEGAGPGGVPEGDAERVAAAGAVARRWGQVVVLKGARTVVAAPDGGLALAPFENPALASGGTGDVLAGAIGALLAQGLLPWDAARLGVYLHGMAGAAVRETFGEAGSIASDLLAQLPLAWRRLDAVRDRGGRRLGFAAAPGSRI